ncbi:beta-fructofuranosidase [Aureococcus anophagefferens]|nr:beta-fructofuranosidase [Aureococcus anophagefferens]
MTLRGLAVLAACAVAIDNACSIDDACDDDAVLIDDVARGDGELLAAADSPNDGLELFSFAEDYAPGPHVVRVACRDAAATAPFDVVAAAPRVATTCRTDAGVLAPCGAGAEGCRDVDGPRFHVVDRSGCAINDPAAPRDPRHGGFHVFYQKRVAAPGGAGPVWGHAVSADLVTWAPLPAALWNGGGGDAVLTGSALPGDDLRLLYAARAAAGAPVHWRVAAPADDADELLVDWRKGAVVAADASRDPAAPWRVADEWRTVAYDGLTYGSTDGFLGTSYAVGREFGPRACECPSLFPLPRTRDGAADASWPTHVFKRSCQENDGAYDQWRLGTYDATRPGEAGAFAAVSGWRRVDAGFTTRPGRGRGDRRFLFGWLQVSPASALSVRELFWDPATGYVDQYPLAELDGRRGARRRGGDGRSQRHGDAAPVGRRRDPRRRRRPFFAAVVLGPTTSLTRLAGLSGVALARCSNPVAGDLVQRIPLRESTTEIRVLTDWTFHEVFFARGRAAMTVAAVPDDGDVLPAALPLAVRAGGCAARVRAYPVADAATTPEDVRARLRRPS